LRRIIEFLNGQMARTEVLAIEVKQYADASGSHHWAATQADIEVSWSKNSANIAVPGATGRHTILRIWTERGLEVRLQTLRQAAGWDDRRCDELVERLEAAAALQFPSGRQWPKAPLAPLADPHARQAFFVALEPALVALRTVP
jgi:hypothetical protein